MRRLLEGSRQGLWAVVASDADSGRDGSGDMGGDGVVAVVALTAAREGMLPLDSPSAVALCKRMVHPSVWSLSKHHDR